MGRRTREVLVGILGPSGSTRLRRFLVDDRGRQRRRLAATLIAACAGLTAISLVVPVERARPTESSASPARDCLIVGAAANRQTPNGGVTASLTDFQQTAVDLGPLMIRRSFDPRLPEDFAGSAGAADAASGLASFVSWKPPGGDFRGAAAGRYDEQVRAWARSVPRSGVFATAYHEPEEDMTASEFVALQRHLYTVVKEANPTIRWGPVYMAYWWDPERRSHYVGDPWAWWPGNEYADFSGLDWYSAKPSPMTQSTRFQHWYDVMVTTGKPLLITEYGQYAVRPGATPDPALQAQRAEAIRVDAEWIADHEVIHMWLYWNGFGAQGDWRIEDRESQEAWRTVAESGCQAPRDGAVNDGVGSPR